MSETMRALVKSQPAEGLWMEDVPIPEPGSQDVLIKVRMSAICGTDVHIWKWDAWSAKTVPVPMVVGHEFCGEIVACGDAAKKYVIGQRVSGEGHVVCGLCRNCRAGRGHLCRRTQGVGVNRPGSFAEYVCIPEGNVVPIPDDIPDEIAAIFDPFGNAVHTAMSFNVLSEDVLVTGAGPIGIMGALVAQRAGARKVVITDINPYRLELARNLGVQHVINANETSLDEVMKSIGMREGFDIGLEMSGSSHAMQDMIRSMNNGGKVALLGIAPMEFSVDWNQIIFKMLHIKGIYGREIFETWYRMIALVQSGLDLSDLITHRIGIDEFEEGFAAMLSGESGKVVMRWPD